MQQKKAEPSKGGTFPVILKRERALRGWSQTDVAARIGSDPKTIGRWERGLTTPGPYLCQRLSELYGKTVQELGLIGDDQQNSSKDEGSAENGTDSEEHVRYTETTQTVKQASAEITSALAAVKWRSEADSHRKMRRNAKRRMLFLGLAIVFLLASAGGVWWYLATVYMPRDLYSGQETRVLNDSLQANSAAGWSLSNNDEGQCFFADGAYRVRVIKTGGYMKLCLAAETYFTDFTYEVKMQVIAGDCGGMGFRTTFPQLYYFVICKDGKYRFVRYDRDHTENRRIMVQGVSSAIQQGTQRTNMLAVVAVGDMFKLYVNQKILYQGTDGAYLDGQIGLLAHSCSIIYPTNRPDVCSVPAEVAFSDARVWT